MKGDPTCAFVDDLRDTVTKDAFTRNYRQDRWLDNAGGSSK